MRINRDEDGYVFYDADFTFLLEDDVPEGIGKLYTVCRDYTREWHERPWTDIGEKVPPVVAYELDAVEVEGINFGGVQEMRDAYEREFHKKFWGK